MKHYWLEGHGGFYNRGCEAIVRSTVGLLLDASPELHCTLYSQDAANDQRELQGNTSIRVRPAGEMRPWAIRASGLLGREGGLVGRAVAGGLVQLSSTRPDCVLSVGGDNLTLDYGPPTMYLWELERACHARIPAVVWAASIGPFTADRAVERKAAEVLRRVDLITVREGISADYLASLGVRDNVVQTWDPAFVLPQVPPPEAIQRYFDSGDAPIGINLSALVARWHPSRDIEVLIREVGLFAQAQLDFGRRILLVPHVTRRDGELHQDDHEVLRRVSARLGGGPGRVLLLPGNLGACQIKWAVARCRFFLAARTHSTIAAVSTGVPTVALAYSQKARGLWRAIFGDEELVAPVAELSQAQLLDKLARLERREEHWRSLLRDKRAEMVAGARRNVDALRERGWI